jgi:hypothetical protein
MSNLIKRPNIIVPGSEVERAAGVEIPLEDLDPQTRAALALFNALTPDLKIVLNAKIAIQATLTKTDDELTLKIGPIVPVRIDHESQKVFIQEAPKDEA